MESFKYYDASNIVDKMIENEEIDCYPTDKSKFAGVYVCMDINDFWVSRITKGYNEDYEPEEGKYLVERNKISIYDVMDKLHEIYKEKLPDFKKSDSQSAMKNKCHNYFDDFTTEAIVKTVVLLDDIDGLSNWDCMEADSLQEAIDMIDDGFGILSVA